MLQGLAVDQTAERSCRFGHPGRQIGPHLIQQPGLELQVHPPPQPLGQQVTGQPQAHGGHLTSPGSGDTVDAKCAVSVFPVWKNTSSARTMRFRSRG